jgi:hypothetical protein
VLGLPAPTYKVIALSPDAPGLVDVAAVFQWQGTMKDARPIHPRLTGPVGEVRNVMGRKNGRELCAGKVYELMTKICQEQNIPYVY